MTSQEADAALALWRQAEASLDQAETALRTGTADARLQERVQDERRRTGQQRAQAQRTANLLRDLDDARMTGSSWIDTHFDDAGAVTKYAAACAAYGLEVTPGRTEELARRIRAEQPAIREALIVALDDWHASAIAARELEAANMVAAIATAADDDPWRQQLRVAAIAGDAAALRALSGQARRMSLRPSRLWRLANRLVVQGDRDEALALLRWARGRHLTDFGIHYSLGKMLYDAKDRSPVMLEEAIGCDRTALAIRPDSSVAHINLGAALLAKNQLDEAIAEYRKAIELDPKFALAHYNLGIALKAKNHLDEASAEYRKAIDLQADYYAEANCNLGAILQLQGRLSDSLDFYKRGHASGSKRKDWRYPSAQWVADAERLVRLEAKLAGVLAGKATAADNRERLGLAYVCRLKRRHVAAARLYAEAFTADPKPADDLKTGYRYSAACSAAMAAAGQGADADKLDDQEHRRLRQQALAWLRADLERRAKQLEAGKPEDRQVARASLWHWQRDPDLASVRDADALPKLTAQEREVWRKLWADVAELLKKAGDVNS